MKKVFFCLALVLLSGSLSACSGVKKKLGLENSAPDEFFGYFPRAVVAAAGV